MLFCLSMISRSKTRTQTLPFLHIYEDRGCFVNVTIMDSLKFKFLALSMILTWLFLLIQHPVFIRSSNYLHCVSLVHQMAACAIICRHQ